MSFVVWPWWVTFLLQNQRCFEREGHTCFNHNGQKVGMIVSFPYVDSVGEQFGEAVWLSMKLLPVLVDSGFCWNSIKLLYGQFTDRCFVLWRMQGQQQMGIISRSQSITATNEKSMAAPLPASVPHVCFSHTNDSHTLASVIWAMYSRGRSFPGIFTLTPSFGKVNRFSSRLASLCYCNADQSSTTANIPLLINKSLQSLNYQSITGPICLIDCLGATNALPEQTSRHMYDNKTRFKPTWFLNEYALALP